MIKTLSTASMIVLAQELYFGKVIKLHIILHRIKLHWVYCGVKRH